MLSTHHPSLSSTEEKPLCVWVFHDQRPGHLNQLQGLISRLSVHHECVFHWFDVSKNRFKLTHILFTPNTFNKLVKPNLILGAGHSTHLSVLFAGLKYQAFTTLIMKPSLPIRFFNAVICPKHDGVANSKTVLNTFGPLNNINRNEVACSKKDASAKLILIGGDSKHYIFDSKSVAQQVQILCNQEPDSHWLISNSPRTPESMNTILNDLDIQNLSFHSYQDKNFGPLNERLLETNFTWVTPDSMSMIFEALTAGSKVELFNLEAKSEAKKNRIVRQVDQLISEGFVSSVNDQAEHTEKNMKSFPWEADNAAIWLIDAYRQHTSKKKTRHD